MKLSVKKSLGAAGCVVFFVICILVVVLSKPEGAAVLYPLGALIVVLFGIKTAGGLFLQKINKDA